MATVYVIGYPKLKNNVKDLICNLDNTLVHLPYTWISATTVMHNMTDIAYTSECYSDYCLTSFTMNFNLNDSDVQCSGNRSGVACGRCAKGLSAVFGSSRCKDVQTYGSYLLLFLQWLEYY